MDIQIYYAAIGRSIARRRRFLGLKQAEVCEKAGLNDKYLSNIERAVSIPSIETLLRIARALDTSPEEFLTDAEVSPALQDKRQAIERRLKDFDSSQLDLTDDFTRWVKDRKYEE